VADHQALGGLHVGLEHARAVVRRAGRQHRIRVESVVDGIVEIALELNRFGRRLLDHLDALAGLRRVIKESQVAGIGAVGHQAEPIEQRKGVLHIGADTGLGVFGRVPYIDLDSLGHEGSGPAAAHGAGAKRRHAFDFVG
jgi:hypothetical protein